MSDKLRRNDFCWCESGRTYKKCHALTTKMLLVPGLVFTIEPMINMGKPNIKTDKSDYWTARSVDGKPSAQWENTVLVTETGHEVLTY